MPDNQPVQGPDGKMYQFPAGTTKDAAIAYFKSKGIGAAPSSAPLQTPGITPPSGKTSIGPTPLPKKEAEMLSPTPEYRKEHPVLSKVGDVVNRANEFATKAAPTAANLLELGGGTAVAYGVAKALPSTAHAGAAIEGVERAAAQVPVATHEVSDIVNRATELGQHGHNPPKVITDLNTALQKGPTLGFKEARDFYTAATRLSTDEVNKATGVMKYQVQQLAAKLGERIMEAARVAGKEKELGSALKEYRRASQLARATDVLIKAAITGAGATAGYKLFRELEKIL